MDKMIYWNELEVKIIELYKSKDLIDKDPILADKLNAVVNNFYSNITKGDLTVFASKVKSITSILNETYFNTRYYTQDLKQKVTDITSELNIFASMALKDPSTLMKKEETEVVRLPNINNEKAMELYNYETKHNK